MKSKSIDIELFVKNTKKYVSADASVSGPETSKNDKQFMRAQFIEHLPDDDGFLGQSKPYTKCFFEDTHPLLYKAAEKAMTDGTPLKIKACRVIIPSPRPFYILDAEGKKMPKKAGGFRIGNSITLFLIADENPITAYNAQINQITAQGAWVETVEPDDDDETPDDKIVKTAKK